MPQTHFGSSPPNEAEPGRPLRVLLVEDHPVNRQTVRILLGDRVDLHEACNGREGLDAIASCDFDLVLMDVDMPVMGGAEATRALRRREAHARRGSTPIILMTSAQCADPRSDALACGANGFLARPITEAALVEVIARSAGVESLSFLGAA